MSPDPNHLDPTADFSPGERVVVRHLDPTGGARDALGVLRSVTDTELQIETRAGLMSVARSTVVLAKRVPPPPSRRGRPHAAISMADLQQVMTGALPPLQSAHLGDWWLRAADGYTGRANSVLVIGDPGRPLEAAIDETVSWYADRGLPPLLQLSGPPDFDPADTEVGVLVAQRGWRFLQRTLVMTAASAELAMGVAPRGSGLRIRTTGAADEAWWQVASERTVSHRATAERVLRAVEDAAYLTAYPADPADSADVLGALRLAFSPGWCGIVDLHVPPAHRRRGIARALVSTAGGESLARGARSAYLQVSADNEPARALYESMGFTAHHEYWYARP